MSGGIFAGAIIICQDDASKPFSPTSASAGISGAGPTRCAVETPSARSLPACTSGSAVAKSPNIICTWPPMMSLSAGARPL